jgi:hypothetical protein
MKNHDPSSRERPRACLASPALRYGPGLFHERGCIHKDLDSAWASFANHVIFFNFALDDT